MLDIDMVAWLMLLTVLSLTLSHFICIKILGEPSLLLDEVLAENVRLANEALLEERGHSGESEGQVGDPGMRAILLDKNNLAVLRRRHAFLNEYSDQMLVNTPIETLLKLENTSIKLKNLEKARDVEERLAANREALMTTEILVGEGRDNRWSRLHEARFLPGAACSAAKLWLRGREVLGSQSQPAVSVYDMAGVGLAGHVTSKGWMMLGDPGNSSISINMFSISNCGKRAVSKAEGLREEDLREIAELGELKVAIRALREALAYAQPWNKSVSALEGFLLQNNYCGTDLEGLEHQANILVGFVDYVLRENSNRWRGQEAFLSVNELKGAWDSFYGSRPQALLARLKKPTQSRGFYKNFSYHAQSQQPHSLQQGGMLQAQQGPQVQVKQEPGQGGRIHVPQAFFWDDICVMFNIGKCVKPAGTCITKKGKPLRHICNFRADPSKPSAYCGLAHAAVFNH